jgi:hypothetical protein
MSGLRCEKSGFSRVNLIWVEGLMHRTSKVRNPAVYGIFASPAGADDEA